MVGNIQLNPIRYVSGVCISCVWPHTSTHEFICVGVYCTHVDIWHKPSFCKRLWLITSQHNWPFRCLQKKRKSYYLQPAVAEPIDGTACWSCGLVVSHYPQLPGVKKGLCVYISVIYSYLIHGWLIIAIMYTSLHFKTVDFYEIMLLLYLILWKL